MEAEKKQKRYVLTENDLKQLQNTELELLVEFDRICRKNNIIYSIDGGTLLGAVRHKGFIPWDDDADVIMVRSEYEKFKQVCKTELDSEKFYFQDMDNTKGYRWGYGKLRKKGTKFIRLNQEMMPYEQGIFMDVFVCDYVPDNYFIRCICNFHSFVYRKIFWSEVAKNTETGLKRVVYQLLNKIPEEKLKQKYRKYVKFRNKKKTGYVKCLTFPACNKTFGYKQEWYTQTEEIKFEDIILMGAKKKEEYLEFLYGNYMQLPPEDKRKVHPVSELQL